MTHLIQSCESYEAIGVGYIGSLEADLSQGVTERARVVIEQAAQLKADKIRAECPKWGAAQLSLFHDIWALFYWSVVQDFNSPQPFYFKRILIL